MLAGQLALIVAALFSGAALYVTFVEHPARRALPDREFLVQWKPAYERGTYMQASLAIAGFVLGAFAWWQTGELMWLAGAVILVANWPYTLIAIRPTNRALKQTAPESAGRQTRTTLERWARLHAGRTVLGLVATLFFLRASVA